MTLELHTACGHAFQRVMTYKESNTHACPGPVVWEILATIPFIQILQREREANKIDFRRNGIAFDLNRRGVYRCTVLEKELGYLDYLHYEDEEWDNYLKQWNSDFAESNKHGEPAFQLLLELSEGIGTCFMRL